jgi:hypothetical protein
VKLAAGKFIGTYTGVEMDSGVPALAWWSGRLNGWWRDLGSTVGSMTGTVGDGEGHWEMVGGREPSPYLQGHDFDDLSSDVGLIGDDGAPVSGAEGELGHHARVLLETRFDTTGAWTAWASHRPTFILARKMQARVRLQRAHLNYEPQAKDLFLQGTV